MLKQMANSESKEAIAERLRLTRLALGYDQQTTFARAIDRELTVQRYNNYEAGRDRLTLNLALAICRRFPVDLDWLYRGSMDELPRRLADAIEALRDAPRAPLTRNQRK